jgi:pilus assembly protein CpaF
VSLRDLVKFVLAMRPDHIVVGEVRGAEAFELTRAVNAGCGFACTVHANSAREALGAIVNAAIMAGENVASPSSGRSSPPPSTSSSTATSMTSTASAHLAGIRRQVTEIIAVVPSLHDDFSTEPIFVREAIGKPLEWTGALPARSEIIERCLPEGMTLRGILEGRVSPL